MNFVRILQNSNFTMQLTYKEVMRTITDSRELSKFIQQVEFKLKSSFEVDPIDKDFDQFIQVLHEGVLHQYFLDFFKKGDKKMRNQIFLKIQNLRKRQSEISALLSLSNKLVKPSTIQTIKIFVTVLSTDILIACGKQGVQEKNIYQHLSLFMYNVQISEKCYFLNIHNYLPTFNKKRKSETRSRSNSKNIAKKQSQISRLTSFSAQNPVFKEKQSQKNNKHVKDSSALIKNVKKTLDAKKIEIQVLRNMKNENKSPLKVQKSVKFSEKLLQSESSSTEKATNQDDLKLEIDSQEEKKSISQKGSVMKASKNSLNRSQRRNASIIPEQRVKKRTHFDRHLYEVLARENKRTNEIEDNERKLKQPKENPFQDKILKISRVSLPDISAYLEEMSDSDIEQENQEKNSNKSKPKNSKRSNGIQSPLPLKRSSRIK